MKDSSSASTLEPITPEPFGRYTLVAKMAVGGMGEIFLARASAVAGLTQLVVLKRIRLELAADPQFQQRFLAEARVLLHLQHGAITQVFDVGAVEGRSYIALEFVDGKDLRALLARAHERGVRLPPGLALQAMLRVLDALAYAHRKKGDDEQDLNLVHRDVSPQNVLVSYEGEVKVIDFGLAKSALSVQRTHPSMLLGKLLYMAPEIAKHDQLDRRADLFAVAVVTHELLTGQHELAGLKPADIMNRVVQPRYRLLEGLIPDAPKGTDAALARGLVADPDQRYRTAEEMRGAFLPLAVAAGSDLSPEDLVRTLTELTVRTVADEVRRQGATFLATSGGGCHNPVVVRGLRDALPGVEVTPADSLGARTDDKEAIAFALIGWCTAHGLPATVPSGTGARGPRVLGTLTPGAGPLRLPEPLGTAPTRLLLHDDRAGA